MSAYNNSRLTEDVQTALVDLQRYLLDQIPPLNASDAVQTLMTQPPQLLMKQVHAWAVEQSRFQQVSMSDCLFHALKKVYLFATLKLVDRGAVETYLNGVVPIAMEICPADERDMLRTNLIAMRDSASAALLTPNVEIGRSTPQKSKAPTVPLTDVVARSARRLGLVIERLTKYVRPSSPSSPSSPEAPQQQPAADLLAMAAASSTSDQQLREYLENLKQYTAGDSDPANLMQVLSKNVPSWDIVVPPDAAVKPPASIEAMHKIISLTADATEMTKRYRGLMMCAVEQFNQGAISASIQMLELAQKVVTEKKIDPSTVERISADAAEALSNEQIKKYSDNKARRALLPKALSFFPKLTAEALFQELRGEQRPERRRAILSLLEAHGMPARERALTELENELQLKPDDVDTYYLRNVIYLLHRIARESNDGVEHELDLLTRASARGQNIYVIKEAIMPVGQIKTDAAVKLLILRLAEFEAMLLRNDNSMYPIEEMQKLLDRIITALARIASPAALLAVARHGMKPNPILGDARARLAVLSQHDLSFDEPTVNVIIKAIRDDLPKRLLGKVMLRVQASPLKLIEALSSTRSEAVESLLTEIAQKFADQDVGRVAAAARDNLASTAKHGQSAPDGSSASLTGDLQFFGLPALMQSLGDNQATGIVTLSSKHGGQTTGKILFVEGKFADAQNAALRGADALYQMLERPIVGTFAFVPQPAFSVNTKLQPQAVMSLLLEGIRRHDELKQACVVAPDEITLKATGSVKPSPDPEESDPAIIREVWLKASSGTPLSSWEPQIATDSYRIRRLVARWIEEGALQPA
jgi:hypothetical protein